MKICLKDANDLIKPLHKNWPCCIIWQVIFQLLESVRVRRASVRRVRMKRARVRRVTRVSLSHSQRDLVAQEVGHFFCFIPPSRLTKRFHPDPACLYLPTCKWCKRYWQASLKNSLYCFGTRGNIAEIRISNRQWNGEGQNRMPTWKTSAIGFSSLGLFVWSKWYIMLRNHLCSLCYWNSIFYKTCNLQIWIQSS